jgi:hypothetical protein
MPCWPSWGRGQSASGGALRFGAGGRRGRTKRRRRRRGSLSVRCRVRTVASQSREGRRRADDEPSVGERPAPSRSASMLGNATSRPEDIRWHLLRYQHVAAIRARLVDHYGSPASARSLTESWRPSSWREAPARRSTSGTPRGVARDGDAPLGARRARPGGMEARTGALRVRGKGNKERLVYVTNEARIYLDRWLVLRGGDPGPLFLPVDRAGKLVVRRKEPGQRCILAREARPRGALYRIRGQSVSKVRSSSRTSCHPSGWHRWRPIGSAPWARSREGIRLPCSRRRLR